MTDSTAVCYYFTASPAILLAYKNRYDPLTSIQVTLFVRQSEARLIKSESGLYLQSRRKEHLIEVPWVLNEQRISFNRCKFLSALKAPEIY